MKYGTGSILVIISTMWKNQILSTDERNEKVGKWNQIMQNGTDKDAASFCQEMICLCPNAADRWKKTLVEIANHYGGVYD